MKQNKTRNNTQALDKARVLELLASNPGANKRDLAKLLGLKGSDRITLKRVLKELEQDGAIEGTKKRGLTKRGELPDITVIEITGTGSDGELELKFIPLNADFQNGDQLVTSGIDAVYPPGLPVAQVTNVERNAAYMFARITCKPLAGVSSHTQVLVVNWGTGAPERPAQNEQAAGKKRRRGS